MVCSGLIILVKVDTEADIRTEVMKRAYKQRVDKIYSLGCMVLEGVLREISEVIPREALRTGCSDTGECS